MTGKCYSTPTFTSSRLKRPRISIPNQQINDSSPVYRSSNQATSSYNAAQSYYPLQTPHVIPSTPNLQHPRKRRATTSSKPDPSQPGLVPVTFNGIASSDTYQSPYIPSAQQNNSSYPQQDQIPTPSSPTFNYSYGHNNGNNEQHSAHQDTNTYDPMFSMPAQFDNEDGHLPHKQPAGQPQPQQQMTPTEETAPSASGSAHADGDGDPFLSLLEQLAENEQSRGGPSELDFFLSGG
jgi:hypothetical protein